MNQEQTSQVNTKSKSYMLVTSEYFGTTTFKYMIRSELRSNEKVTLFLLGIPDPAVVYASRANTSKEDITKNLFQAATNSIADFLENNDWIEGGIYYGEYMVDGSFDISAEKPAWEDGQWGQKI